MAAVSLATAAPLFDDAAALRPALPFVVGDAEAAPLEEVSCTAVWVTSPTLCQRLTHGKS
jgi:hypothetical protein